MDWARAIERNSEALEGIIATLAALLEQAGGAAAKLPRAVYRALLSLLRPAEAAVRRLIVIAALGLTVKPAPPRPKPAGTIPRGKGEHLAFPLCDPRKDFSALSFAAPAPAVGPRIRVFGYDPRVAALFPAALPPAPVPVAPPSPAETTVDARRLVIRIAALKAALANLPRQARRLIRWRARFAKKPAPKFKSPLRPGRPPGQRRPPKRDIDFVLAECHALAIDALRPDTS